MRASRVSRIALPQAPSLRGAPSFLNDVAIRPALVSGDDQQAQKQSTAPSDLAAEKARWRREDPHPAGQRADRAFFFSAQDSFELGLGVVRIRGSLDRCYISMAA
jgi:hypothetical protein